jgi:hypothetical protein
MEEMTKAEVQDIKMETQGIFKSARIKKTLNSGDTPLAKQLASNDLAGITPEELHTKTVLDITKPNLDILFVGINPGYHSALTGHHYSGTGKYLMMFEGYFYLKETTSGLVCTHRGWFPSLSLPIGTEKYFNMASGYVTLSREQQLLDRISAPPKFEKAADVL